MKITKITATGSGIVFNNVMPTGNISNGYTNVHKKIVYNDNFTDGQLNTLSDESIGKVINCISIDWNNSYLPNTFNQLSSDITVSNMKTRGGIKDSSELLYILDKLSELI